MSSSETNSLLRLFGSSAELLAKADSDLARFTDALACGKQREALWTLMDCSITVFHVADWIRTTHTDHRRATTDFATRSQWIRMTRDIGNAAKHADLTWKAADAPTHGPVLSKLEYVLNKPEIQTAHRILALAKDGERYDVVDVLRNAIGEWREFIAAKGI